MLYQSMSELLIDLRQFVKENPTAYIQVNDVPQKLWIGFSAMTDDEVEYAREWTITLSKFREATTNTDNFTPEEHKAIGHFFKARVEFNDAQTEYLKAITRA
jgi:hypothetical protein